MRIFLWLVTLAALIIVNLAVAGASARPPSPSPNSTCTHAAPCIVEQNTGTGAGIEGDSDQSYGLVGVTKAPSTSSNSVTAATIANAAPVPNTGSAGDTLQVRMVNKATAPASTPATNADAVR